MRTAQRLFSIVTTEMHGGRDRAKSIVFEEIVFALRLWKKASESSKTDRKQPMFRWVNAEAKSGINEVEETPLVNVSEASYYICKNEGTLCQLMK